MIFISYRRLDSAHFVDRLYPRLIRAFGDHVVFKDVNSIQLGVAFDTQISKVLAESQVVLVVIGDQWLAAKDESGVRRIDQTDDPVHIEVSTALMADKAVVPVAIGSTRVPSRMELPTALSSLASRNGMHIRSEPYFHSDVDLLIERIARTGLPDWMQGDQSRQLKISEPFGRDESIAHLLDRLITNMQAWYNELVKVGERIRAASNGAEVDRIVLSYVHTRQYLPEVVAVRDLLGPRSDMQEVVATVNAFLDRLTIKTASVDHSGLLCRDNMELFGFKPYNPLLDLQHQLQQAVTLVLRFKHGVP